MTNQARPAIRTHRRGLVDIKTGNGRTVILTQVIPIGMKRPDAYEVSVQYAEDANLNFTETRTTKAAARVTFNTWSYLTRA
jgi:hypothetical protein